MPLEMEDLQWPNSWEKWRVGQQKCAFLNGNLPAVAILIDLWTLQYAIIGIYRNYFAPTCPAWRTISKEARDFAPELVLGPHMASQFLWPNHAILGAWNSEPLKERRRWRKGTDGFGYAKFLSIAPYISGRHCHLGLLELHWEHGPIFGPAQEAIPISDC